MVKENSIIPVGAVNNVPNYDYEKDVTLKVFNLLENKEAYSEVVNGNTDVVLKAKVLKVNNTITFDVEAKDNYSILINGEFNIEKVEGAEFKVDKDGIRLTPNANKIIIALK